jgi:hypothetical protein
VGWGARPPGKAAGRRCHTSSATASASPAKPAASSSFVATVGNSAASRAWPSAVDRDCLAKRAKREHQTAALIARFVPDINDGVEIGQLHLQLEGDFSLKRGIARSERCDQHRTVDVM